MDSPFDRRAFLKTAAGTLALPLSPSGLTAANRQTAAAIAGPPVRFAPKANQAVLANSRISIQPEDNT